MAKTAQRKVEIAERIREVCCSEHGLDPQLLIFDCLTFTLTTGEAEWRPSAVETIAGIRRIKAEIPGVKTSLGVSNVSFGVSPGARAVLNSVFLHHCVQAGLDLAMVNPNHITPYGEIPQAIYFGTRQGRLLPNGSPDALIKGSPNDPSLFGELGDEDPPDGAVEEEDEPAMAG